MASRWTLAANASVAEPWVASFSEPSQSRKMGAAFGGMQEIGSRPSPAFLFQADYNFAVRQRLGFVGGAGAASFQGKPGSASHLEWGPSGRTWCQKSNMTSGSGPRATP